MADEALQCFESLLESVPTWIADLEDMLKAATEKQNEILFESQPAADAPVLFKKRSKSSSLRSHRSKDERKDSQVDDSSQSQPPRLLRTQLPHMTDSDALRLSQRKRKTASVCSGDQSGPSKFRSRAMVVVYYDGEAQKKFETLVRSIGTGRNAVRKGKMGAKVDSLSRTGSSSSEGSSSGEDRALQQFGKLGYRSTRSPRMDSRMFGKDNTVEAFDKVDACLEKGQSLCERAAHQILRDGDCALELNNAREHLNEAIKLARAELPALKKRAEKAAERQKRSEERRRAEERERKNRLSDTVSIQQVSSLGSSIPSEGKLEVDLEADDSEDGEADFAAVTALQLGKGRPGYQMRTSRLAGLAH
jgi:hypothetical protein